MRIQDLSCGIVRERMLCLYCKDKGDKSLVDDLNKERGIVSGRVAFVATIC